ncbi:polysaccharide pyruvyl transferase family protein [Streptomyces sp. Z26]|uniref:polysaccharide pyruvyl transferase family protein n=1 Tax=Streptomyces sp. Z26 TaxID=2500177 RepID=UPI000EF15F24|nr:polysaccharide pyruvyl transferase family protein [Streptomyces sp. Z26]RLL67228.1 polysaccharide pyruvyl transferase family protein [Streptomyces sp. Z26]
MTATDATGAASAAGATEVTDAATTRVRGGTGKRRIAFACHVAHEDRVPGLLALLRSLALTNPGLCEDFLVLHDGLPERALDAARRLHPRVVPRRAASRRELLTPPWPGAAADGTGGGTGGTATGTDGGPVGGAGYDTVVAFTTGMVVLGDLSDLLRLRHGIAAVPQPYALAEGDDGTRARAVRDDGLYVLQRDAADPPPATGEASAAARTPGGPRVRGEVPARPGPLVHLDARYDFLAARLYDDAPVPDHVVVLDFGEGAHRPWDGGLPGHGPAERAWRRYDMADDAFRRAFCALPGPRHPDLFAHCAAPLLATGSPPSVNMARELAAVHLERGRYEQAVEVLAPVLERAQPDQPRFHETAGTALMAVSRYDEAEAHLLLATAAPHLAPRAFARLARMAWLRGDDEAARGYAREGLDSDPTDRGCRTLYGPPPAPRGTPGDGASDRPAPVPVPAPVPTRERRQVPPAEQFAHVALFSTGKENAGDKVLPEAVRMCLDSDTGPDRWLSVPVHRLFDERALEQVNARRALVVGGGGLFLPDTWPNGNSAWQWNAPDDAVRRVTVPLAVFAVGYNAFDGQEYGRGRFVESLRTLVERSAFFGLRNHGSVERVRDLLPASLRDRVRWQPCPTTVTRHLVPGWTDPAERAETALVNCAYDRAGLRFGHDYGHFLAQMAAAVRALRGRVEVRYAAHLPADERFVHDLRREHGLTLPVDPLHDFGNDAIRDHYARTRLVIGMRGHATMIAFGSGTPSISLVSHPKLAYFLEDVGRPEWGVSVHDRELGAVLTERATAFLDDHDAAVADVHGRQRALWRTTAENLRELGDVLG